MHFSIALMSSFYFLIFYLSLKEIEENFEIKKILELYLNSSMIRRLQRPEQTSEEKDMKKQSSNVE